MAKIYHDLFEACAKGSVEHVQQLLTIYQLRDMDVLDNGAVEAVFSGNIPVIHFFLNNDSLHPSIQKNYAHTVMDDMAISKSPSYLQEILHYKDAGMQLCHHLGAEVMLESLMLYDAYILLPVLHKFLMTHNIQFAQSELQTILFSALKRRHYDSVDELLNLPVICDFTKFDANQNAQFLDYAALARDADLLHYILNNHKLYDIFKVQNLTPQTLHNMQALNLQQHLAIVESAKNNHQ